MRRSLWSAEWCPSKDVPIPRTHTWVTLHDKGELRLLMELRLLISDLEIGRWSWIIWSGPHVIKKVLKSARKR